MRTLTFILAAAACVGLSAPAFATDTVSPGQTSPQLTRADASGKASVNDEVSTQSKKKKRQTSGQSWGGY